MATAGKLMAVFRASKGDPTWAGSAKRLASRAGLYMLAAVVPLLLWSTYLLLAFWAIGVPRGAALSFAHAPEWLTWSASLVSSPEHLGTIYFVGAIALLLVSALVRPNAGSLHGYYRDRLSRAFLWQREALKAYVRKLDGESSGAAHRGRGHGTDAGHDTDRYKFSSLKKRTHGPGSAWSEDVRFAPYLIVNAAVNLGGSKYLNRRGRNADNFIFSPLFMGSEATKYVSSACLEEADPDINLGTAMAASGAAASSNMGASTIRPLIFSLSALNVRLGYWLPNPRRAPAWRKAGPANLFWWYRSIGPLYFTLETFGAMHERRRNVYITDGGHFDNLGLYELLKRRCKIIIVADAEADPPMVFDSFIRLQSYARIDLGVRIDLPIEALKRSALGISQGRPVDPRDDRGPHVAVGRIAYGATESGVLIYVKACLSGDENDLLRDYKRRNPDFPHESTIDQFFSEEQFEVYRALGFHATGFFTGQDRFATLDPEKCPGWLDELDGALRHLNVPRSARARILARAAAGPASTAAATDRAGVQA